MKAYYCISPRDREFLYIPFVLFSYCSVNSATINHNWNEETLDKLTLILKERKITRKKLEGKEWEVEEVQISGKRIGNFVDSCFAGKPVDEILNKADKMFNLARDYIEKEDDCCIADDNATVYRDSYDGMYDEEDYGDDWWKRGEDPEWE